MENQLLQFEKVHNHLKNYCGTKQKYVVVKCKKPLLLTSFILLLTSLLLAYLGTYNFRISVNSWHWLTKKLTF